eukprot:CAMPEP_0201605094 /NCGR_PEP_ID=MMETSP0492-20130828/5030_1 /ASSEMBLY_ACC=CAM_ASM_000837 /TAXON_ID=420259 /ORGANISM="Thalassiosira gravida, Strain GMp14c1" /LENGTH=210 /DNA_ID=CAMNT_0048069273 /DNA_START=13 /DNA_END=645 /DNA_ORIENTATION=+
MIVQPNEPSRTLSMSSAPRRLISCIYNADIYSGYGGHITPKSTVINFVSNDSIDGIAPSTLAPSQIQKALYPAKAAVFSTIGSFECVTCGNDAYNICSSIAAYRGTDANDSAFSSENVLHFFERIICSCDNVKCISEARRKRNTDPRKDGRMGFSFGLAFRCALEPIASVLSSTKEVGKGVALSNYMHEEENTHAVDSENILSSSVEMAC